MIAEEQLYTLIHSLFGPANARIKDTGKYFIANQEHATAHGFSDIDSSIGINYAEMCDHRRTQLSMIEGSLSLEDKCAQLIEHLHWSADRTKEPVSANVCTLFPNERIQLGLLKKIPILGHKNQVIAILTFFEDKTNQLDLLTLYNLYKKHYPMQRAIIQFLNYLNIRQYFKKIPTNQELIVLMMLRESAASKYVAKMLGINYRTVEEYKARLRNKLSLVSLEKLLVGLRASHKVLVSHLTLP